ncbi:MAG: hypothetical protein DRO99_01315 [Candidatus Aenigmatarchaeota archaeon]|nr:MAG: hypothetical protein DRO99_01315 [Candidatus Aenigmarchaeota archaeon]
MMNYARLCENADIWGYDAAFSVIAFLQAINSPRLSDLPEFARWIDEAGKQYDINQRILLAIAQKEQSFLTRPKGGRGWRRALQYTMGYGATDRGDIPKYAGCRTQVFAAAEGLRRYWDSGRVQKMVGKPLAETLPWTKNTPTGKIIPENEATAALYLYTPHLSGARDFVRVWRWLKGVEAKMAAEDRLYPEGYPKPLRRYGRVDPGHVKYWFGNPCQASHFVSHRVPILGRVYVHRRVAEAFEQVLKEIEEAGLAELIDLSDYGGTYCCRRVRGGRAYSPHAWGIAIDLNVHHLQGPNGEYRAGRTNWRCRPSEIPNSLKRLAPFFRRWGFSWGGDWKSFKDPMHFEATALTVKLLEGGELPQKFIEVCRAGQQPQLGYVPGEVKVVLLPDNKVIPCNAYFDGEKAKCNLRELAEGLGYVVADHIPDQRKVYLVPREAKAHLIPKEADA